MKKNMGKLDSIIRLTVAVVIAYLLFAGKVEGTLAIVLGIVGVAMIFTSLFGFCPLYPVLGINSKGKKDAAS
jgi:hypothetical protein